MADIKIKIGASVDSDLSNIFRPIRDEARRTRQQISSDQKAFDKAMYAASLAQARDKFKAESALNQSAFKAKVAASLQADKQMNIVGLAQARDRHRAETQLNQAAFKARVQADRDAIKQATQLAMEGRRNRTAIELAGIRETAAAARLASRQSNSDRVRQERMAAAGGGGLIGYFGGRHVVSGAGRDFGRIAGGASRLVGQVGRGLGIDFDVSSMVRRNVERDRMARDISNSAYQPGVAGPAGVRQDHNKIVTEAESLGMQARIDPTKALEGMQKFVEVSGDLATARTVMKDLAFLSQATGSHLNDVAEAAGNVSVQLADTPDKAQKVVQVMRAVAGQGKLGAVELRDMAKQMAALAANASNFAGRPEDAITMMGVLAQEARQHGSAKSASEAAFSVSSLVQTFSKNPRVAAMKAAGINVFNEKGQINDIQKIITAILVKTGGNRIEIGGMVKDARARRAIMGFENIYRNTNVDAVKGESKEEYKIRNTTAKVAVVTQEFDRMKRIAMGEGEIKDSARLAMESPAAKAQAFQNELDRTTKEIQGKLLPMLEKLAPDIIKVVGALGNMVEWAADNPMAAIFTALAGSVAKAGVGEMIARAMGLSLGGVGALGGVGGAAGGALGIATFASQLGVATLALGGLGLAADQAYKLWNETHTKTSFAPGTSEEEKKRMTPTAHRGADGNWITEEQDAKRIALENTAEIAASTNIESLERSGRTTGKRGTFGPPTAAVAEMIDSQKLLTTNELQAKLLGSILGAQLTTVSELQRLSAGNPEGAAGFSAAPPPISKGGTTSDFGSMGGAASH